MKTNSYVLWYTRAFFLGLLTLTFTTYASNLSKELDSLINKELPNASVGVYITDLYNGKRIYERNGGKLLSPASGIKLFTAAASLYRFGPDYRYETELRKSDQDIYVRFSGDPSLKTADLKALINQLKTHHIDVIEGDVIVDASHYQAPYYAGGINYDDLGWYYVAPSSAVILDENKTTFEFYSAKKIGGPVKIKSLSPNSPVKLINHLVSASAEQKRNHCNFNIEIKPENTLRLYGCLPQYKDPRRLSLAITNPALYASNVIRDALNDNDIQLKGQIINGKTPANSELLAKHQSKPLLELISHMLLESDNLYADSLTKQLGVSLTRQGTYKQGAYAIKKVIAKHTHLNTDKLDISDGQGTRYNLVSPAQMVTLLQDLYQDKNMRDYMAKSLPRMGESGSLAWRMRDTDLKKRVMAKTGTMHDISSLSGYFMTKSAKPIAFSIIINGMYEDISKAKNLEEKMLLIISKHVD